jgi:retron-type reverse transcriptase
VLAAWREFVRGKRKRTDVQAFQLRLFDNVYALHRDLAEQTYRHGDYEAFKINDPKPRDIHKATVRDRLVHRALYRVLYRFFERTFIADSYSCRRGKGVHKALDRFTSFAFRASHNHTRTVWVLKCDLRKFFASIDQNILLDIVSAYVPDESVRRLIAEIVGSFHSTSDGIGLPLGNLTSQLLVNVYMNEFDRFAKHQLKAAYYIRYADDFVIFSPDKQWLTSLIPRILIFLRDELRLTLHPGKVSISTVATGVDFLGWVHFPDHRVLRSATRRRMFRRLEDDPAEKAMQSYCGLLSHGNAQKLRLRITAGRVGLARVQPPSHN